MNHRRVLEVVFEYRRSEFARVQLSVIPNDSAKFRDDLVTSQWIDASRKCNVFLSPFPSTIVQESAKVLSSLNEFQESRVFSVTFSASRARTRALILSKRADRLENSRSRRFDGNLLNDRSASRTRIWMTSASTSAYGIWSHQGGDKTTTPGESAVYRSVDRSGNVARVVALAARENGQTLARGLEIGERGSTRRQPVAQDRTRFHLEDSGRLRPLRPPAWDPSSIRGQELINRTAGAFEWPLLINACLRECRATIDRRHGSTSSWFQSRSIPVIFR